ncbi:MAG: leucine-rich repeat domain-containing protein [Clostridia bacterium]|nr:leucine-rich repeat domain-containing protein [Clostridia bacterium]
MKELKKILVGLLAFASVSAFALGVTACEKVAGVLCNHIYNQEIVGEKYLKNEATCTSKSTYYKSCNSCGKAGLETFEYGDLLKHTPVKGVCSMCEKEVGSTGLRYELEVTGKYYIVSIGTCKDLDVYIPKFYNNTPVKEIPREGFANSDITSITIPKSVTSIRQNAFYDCDALASVTMPDSVSIGYEAFADCDSLTSVVMGDDDSETTIGYGAFKDCDNLTRVTIGDSVTTIGNAAFSGCYRITEVYNKSSLNITLGSSDNGSVGYYATHIVTEENERGTFATDENGYIVYTNGNDKVIVRYTGEESKLTLPSDITQIKSYAFYNCNGLTSVTIGNSVTTIGESAFYYCDDLTRVAIGNSVTTIGDDAFKYCDLTSVIFADTSTWYRTWNEEDWHNKVNGTQVDVSDAETAADLLTEYTNYYWYKL